MEAADVWEQHLVNRLRWSVYSSSMNQTYEVSDHWLGETYSLCANWTGLHSHISPIARVQLGRRGICQAAGGRFGQRRISPHL